MNLSQSDDLSHQQNDLLTTYSASWGDVHAKRHPPLATDSIGVRRCLGTLFALQHAQLLELYRFMRGELRRHRHCLVHCRPLARPIPIAATAKDVLSPNAKQNPPADRRLNVNLQVQLRSAFYPLASVTSRAVVADPPKSVAIKIREIRGRCPAPNAAAAPHQRCNAPKKNPPA